MVLDIICCDALESAEESEMNADTDGSSTGDGILECDYDSQVTKLYHSIEERKWEEVLYFLETGKWYSTSLFSAFADLGESQTIQARTWVTALDGSGNVRWCQLPLHAAVTFLAPFSIISKLVEVYPKSVRCADDQDMLPLHYAFRFGAEDDVLLYLLEKFPQAVSKKAVKDRLPLDLAHFGPRPERGNIIDYYMQSAVRNAKNEWDSEYEKMVAGMRNAADSELQKDLKAKTAKLVATMAELNKTKKDFLALKREIKETKRREASRESKTPVSDVETLESDYDEEEMRGEAQDDEDEQFAPIRAPKRPKAHTSNKLRTLSSPRARSTSRSRNDDGSRRSRSRSGSRSGKRSTHRDDANRKSTTKKKPSKSSSSKKSGSSKKGPEERASKRGLRSIFGIRK